LTDLNDPWDIYHQQLETHKRWEEQRQFWRDVMSSEVGRREMWALLDDVTHTFDVQFAHGPTGFPDPLATWLRAGQQSVGRAIHDTLFRYARESTLLMHDEHDRRFDRPTMPEPPDRRRDIPDLWGS
jgi:hypothetical protein